MSASETKEAINNGGTMKFVSSAIRVSAVLLLASAGLGGGIAVASPNPPTSPPGTSPIDQFVQSQGSTVIANQQKLSDFKYWIVTQPGIEAAGYVEQVNDAATLSTKLLWKGQSPLRAVVLAEAKARGITATFGERPYSLPEIRAAIKKIDAKKGAMAAAGFQVDTIVGVRDDSGAIAVEGHSVTAAAASGAATSGVVLHQYGRVVARKRL